MSGIKKKALFLCSGREGASERMMMKPILRQLHALQYEVEYLAPDDFTLDPSLSRITWPSAVELPGLRWLHRTFFFPLVVSAHCAQRRYDAIITTDPYMLFVSWPASLLIVARRILLLPSAPWSKQRRKRRFVLSRYALGFQDFLGMLSSSTMLASCQAVRADVADVASILKSKVRVLPIAQSTFDANEMLKAQELQAQRHELLARYDLPDRTKIFAANISDASFSQAERCLRLFAVSGTSRSALFFLGENEEQNSLMAITVGLGLTEQVFFIEAKEEEASVVRHTDVYFMLDERDEGSQVANEARLYQALIIPFALEHSSIPSEGCTLTGKVAKDAEQLEAFLSRKDRQQKLRELQVNQAQWQEQEWGERASALLGLS